MLNLNAGMKHLKVYILMFILFMMVALATATIASAALVVESTGPGGYGWNQSYDLRPTPDIRLTGSSDRMYYDHGYKGIQIMGRRESFWATNCGWWYVTHGGTITINLTDAVGHLVLTNTSHTLNKTVDRGMYVHTYTWGTGDDPGVWNVTVSENSSVSVSFRLFVRGQLNVTSITTSADPRARSNVTIHAVLRDNAGAGVLGNETHPVTVTAHISGAGENFVFTMYDDGRTGGDTVANNSIWTNNSLTPSRPGTYFITVKASDGHVKWIDGSNSTKIGVGGEFIPAMMFIPIFERIDRVFAPISALVPISSISMILGAFVLGKRMMWGRI